MLIVLQSRFGFVEALFVGLVRIYWDRIALLAGGGEAILISIFARETFVAGPAGRRDDGRCM